jgi:tRNA pseudouridine55 synthase
VKIADGDFLLPVDKPVGPTSHDVVGMARRALGTRRVGHTGTLDPFASGLLVLCVGRATRLAEYFTGLDKRYEAVAKLGAETDTLDLEGDVVSGDDGWRGLDRARIESVAQTQVGQLDQVPPQFSAKRVDGERMHRRARRGEEIHLAPARVSVYALTVRDVALPDVRFSVHCSTGTYVRAIARDLGRALGCGAHLTALRRTAVGSFHVDAALPVQKLADEDALAGARIGPSEALGHLPTVPVDPEMAARIRNGQRVRIEASGGTSEALVTVTCGTDLLAMAEIDDGVLRPRKVFAA